MLFNFGQLPTSLPGADSGNELAFHSYALDVAGEEAVVAHAVAAAERDDAAVMATEFGATTDPSTLRRLTGQLDGAMVPWIFWAYEEQIIIDRSVPASLDAVASVDALRELVHPYPTAVAGTPESMAFDAETRTFDLVFDTDLPGSRRPSWSLESVISMPDLQYPDGYTAVVEGAKVTSRPCAEHLTLRAKPRAERSPYRSCRRGLHTLTFTPRLVLPGIGWCGRRGW